MPTKETWVPRAQAVEYLGISDRQLQRYASPEDGRVGRRTDPGTEQVLYCWEDVQALKAGTAVRRPRVSQAIMALMASRGETAPEAPTSPVSPAPTSATPPLLEAPKTEGNAPEAATSEPEEGDAYTPEPVRPPRLWCTISEASRWSGLPVGYLKACCEGAAIEALNVSASNTRKMWRIRTAGLYDLRGLKGEPR